MDLPRGARRIDLNSTKFFALGANRDRGFLEL
jgi:hypothetical protein